MSSRMRRGGTCNSSALGTAGIVLGSQGVVAGVVLGVADLSAPYAWALVVGMVALGLVLIVLEVRVAVGASHEIRRDRASG